MTVGKTLLKAMIGLNALPVARPSALLVGRIEIKREER